MDPMVWLLKNRYGSLELSRQVGPNMLRGLAGSVLLHTMAVTALFLLTMIHAGDHTKIGRMIQIPIEILPPRPHVNVLPPIINEAPHVKPPDVVTRPVPVPGEPPAVNPPASTQGKQGIIGPNVGPGTYSGPIDPTADPGEIFGNSNIPDPGIFIPREYEPVPLDINPNPTFPSIAQLSGVSGKVVINVFVDKQGTVRKWTVIKANPAGLGFEDEVVRVIPKWKFTPAIQQGHPVGVWVAIPFIFSIHK